MRVRSRLLVLSVAASSPVKAHTLVDRRGHRAAGLRAPKLKLTTLDYPRSEGDQGRRSDFEHYLNSVPDVPAAAGDEVD